MTTRNPEDSVQNEQFDGLKKTTESAEETDEMAISPEIAATGPVTEISENIPEEAAEEATETVDVKAEEAAEAIDVKAEEAAEAVIAALADKAGDISEVAAGDAESEAAEAVEDEAEGEEEEATSGEMTEPPAEDEVSDNETPEEEHINYYEIELPPVDYSGFSRKELVETLALIVENRPPAEIIDDVSRI